MKSNDWKVTKLGNLADIQPVDDMKDHDFNNCWCDPELEIVDGGVLQIHHSKDKREKYEKGHLKLV